MDLTQREMIVYRHIYTKSFNVDLLIDCLENLHPTSEEITRIAYKYVDDCFLNSEKVPNDVPRNFGTIISGCESGHMVEVIGELVKYGLNPNSIFIDESGGERNIMENLQYVDNGYVAADTLALLLEHGGNPSIILDGDSLVRKINFDLTFDLVNQDNRLRYDSEVHFWMVLIGYGARLEHGESCIDVCDGFDCSRLRNHRDYYYGAIHSDKSNDGIEICFFDRKTNCEVARY